jgi:hypothetical protein
MGEVGYMMAYFPDVVKLDVVKTLKSSKHTLQDLMRIAQLPGGFKEHMPLGIIGNPSAYNTEEAKFSFDDSARRAALTIAAKYHGTYKPPETFKPYKPKNGKE